MFGSVALLALSSFPTLARDAPTLEVGGGYAFRSWQVPPLAQPPSRYNMNGWNANVPYNVIDKIGSALDVAGTRNNSNGDQSICSFMPGPRLYPMGHHKLTSFVHVMAGLGRYKLYLLPDDTIPEPALNYSENRLAFDFGGGIDAMVNSRVAIRVAQVAYERTVFTVFTDPASQNNFRFSAGVVVHFGAK
jgi:Outer membrane protein beta-barrel domain